MKIDLKIVLPATAGFIAAKIFLGWWGVLGVFVLLALAILFIGLFGRSTAVKTGNNHAYLPKGIRFPIALIGAGMVVIGYILFELTGGELWPFFAAIGLFVGYILSGIQTVQQDEVAAYLVFGKATQNLEPGLVIVPPFIASVERFTSATIHFIIGVRTDKEGNIIPNEPVGDETVVTDNRQRLVNFAGKDTALDRIPDKSKYDHTGTIEWTKGGNSAQEHKDDALQKPLTSSPLVAVLLRVSSAQNLIRAAGSLQNAFGNVARLTEGILNQFAGKNTLRFCIMNAEDVTDAIQRRVEWLVGDPDAIKRIGDPNVKVSENDQWGLDIESVQVLYWGQSYPLNQALENVAIAQLTKQSVIEEKTGEAEGIKLVGKANADAASSMRESQSADLAYKLAVLKAMVETAKGANLVIASGTQGVEDVVTKSFATGLQAQKALDGQTKPTKS